jgi:hypothetical protein
MLRKAIDEQFIEIVDDLVMMSESDADLAEGIRWIDSQSQKNGLTFYEMVYIITEKYLAEEKAKKWLSKKSTGSRKKLMYV